VPRRRDDERWLADCVGDLAASPNGGGDAAEDLDDTVFQLLTNDILATR
jgi:hypothetical protein